MRIERILANNPGPYTGPGTNTWILADGSESAVVIDPGPLDAKHEETIESRLAGLKVQGVLVTHTHEDHAPLANPLARNLGVPTLGFGPGPGFSPDTSLGDGDAFAVGTVELSVVHTPGHSNDHLCFRSGNVLFTGDHIMGGSSVMVEALGPYLESLRKLRGVGLERLLPGHGEEMAQPDEVIDWYLAHRMQRHQQILDSIARGIATREEVVEDVYSDVDKSLYPLAAMSVAAHLALLTEEGRIALGEDGTYVLTPQPPPQAP